MSAPPPWPTGPQPAYPTRPQAPYPTRPPAPWPAGPQAAPRRWPTTRQPWPGPAGLPEPGSGQQTGMALRPDPADRADRGDQRLAAFGYLSVPFLGPVLPLAICLLRGRAPGYLRGHGAQALDLAITALLYGICTLILGAMLALDSLVVALVVAVPVAVALWLVTLSYAIRAGTQARHGAEVRLPSWLCASIVR
jgi:uncharacterized Tic20 family protein